MGNKLNRYLGELKDWCALGMTDGEMVEALKDRHDEDFTRHQVNNWLKSHKELNEVRKKAREIKAKNKVTVYQNAVEIDQEKLSEYQKNNLIANSILPQLKAQFGAPNDAVDESNYDPFMDPMNVAHIKWVEMVRAMILMYDERSDAMTLLTAQKLYDNAVNFILDKLEMKENELKEVILQMTPPPEADPEQQSKWNDMIENMRKDMETREIANQKRQLELFA